MYLQRSETKRGTRDSIRGGRLRSGTKRGQEEHELTKEVKETKVSVFEITLLKITLKEKEEEESKEIEKVTWCFVTNFHLSPIFFIRIRYYISIYVFPTSNISVHVQ